MSKQKEEINKEEGEITDDDDVEYLLEERPSDERYGRCSSTGSSSWATRREKDRNKSERASNKSRHTVKTHHRPKLLHDPSHVNQSESYNRPESPVFRGYGNRSNEREGRGSEHSQYGSYQRREGHYEDHSQKSINHTPNYGRMNDWLQRKFYGSSRSVQSDGFSRQNSQGLYRMDQPPPDYYRANPEPGGRYARSVHEESFQKKEQMENDYHKLLQYYAEVQAEMKQLRQHSPSPHTDDSLSIAGAGVDPKLERAEKQSPLMTIAEVVSDVSSDEASFSQEQKPASSCDKGFLHQGDGVESTVSAELDCEGDGSKFDAHHVDETSASSAAEGQPQVEEEDLDVLELRRIALESAALRKHKQQAESDLPPDSSQSSSSVTTAPQLVAAGKSQSVRSKTVFEVIKNVALELEVDRSSSTQKGAAAESSPVKQEIKGHGSKGHPDQRIFWTRSKHSLEPTRSVNRASSNEKEGFRDSDSRSSTEHSRRDRLNEKETSSKSKIGSRKGKSDKELSVRSRPLPFAPTRIETIRLKSLSTRSSSLADAAKRVQRRARQASVARQLPPKSSAASSSNGKHSTLHKLADREHSDLRKSTDRQHSDLRKSADPKGSDRKSAEHYQGGEGEEVEKKVDERSLEMNRILSLKDQKEQVISFLKLISFDGTGAATSSMVSSPKTKVLASTDNYEEVEMDMDSGDELEGILRKNDIQITAPPAPSMRPEAMMVPQGTDTMMAPISWGPPPLYIPTPMTMPSTPFAVPPPLPLQLLPPLPPAEEPVPPPPPPPPLPEDFPPTPPPPPSMEEPGASSSEESPRNDRERISKLAQFFKAKAVAKQENVQTHVDISKHALWSSSPEQSFPEPSVVTPVVQRSSEDVASEHSASPYSSPSKPLGAGPRLKPEDIDDEDEAVMRERLLRSLLIRRKEMAEGKAASTSSKESSPTPSGTASPQPQSMPKTVKSVHASTKPPAFYRRMEFPVHKPVVVTLNSSSSEDEDDISPKGKEALVSSLDIDSFLKAQRKTAEGRTPGSVTALPRQQPVTGVVPVKEKPGSLLQEQTLLKQKENHLSSLKRLLLMEELKLKTLGSKWSHYMNEKKTADFRVAQLRKQLAVAEKLAADQATLVLSHRDQMKQTKESIQRKKVLVQSATEKALTLGCRLLGPGYVLGSCPSPQTQSLKRKTATQEVNMTSQPSDSKRQRPTSPQGSQAASWASGSGQGEDRHSRYSELQQKKAALEQKIQKQRQKLQQYQKREPLFVSVASPGGQRSVVENRENVKPQEPARQRGERLPSLESIRLDPLEDMSAVKHSRRSLLDMTQSPKPTLILRDRHSPQEGAEGQGKEEGAKKGGEEFRMPSGSQLTNLCRIQREKMEKVLSTHGYQPLKLLANLNPPCHPIAQLTAVLPGHQQSKPDSTTQNAKFAYTSPLLQFRAYRFSSYYRTKEGLTLTSHSFSHKLNPNRVLCRYDMQGTCNDRHCTWQHEADYRLSDREILMDLVSYCPSLAGVNSDTPISAYPTLIGDYVDNLVTQHKGKMTFDHLCLFLTAKVNDAAKHGRPHTMFYERRPWRPCTSESSTFSLSITSQFQTPDHGINCVTRCEREADSVVDVDDVRYFGADKGEGGEVQDMEGAVLATPNDIHLWLRLAYSKVSNPARSKEERLSQALNVLSRGLENNKNSSELWIHYLSLFRQHTNSDSEFVEMCQMALTCAPCYDIWWLLLEATSGFHAKDTVCNKTLQFLCEEMRKKGEEQEDGGFGNNKVLSHQTLEMLLYKVQLNIQSGRFKTALNFIQAVAGVNESCERDAMLKKALTHADQCVLWICLAHLVEFQSLPTSLYDPTNQNPGRIRSKDRLHIPWQSRPSLRTVLGSLVQYLAQAVTLDLDRPLDNCTSPQYVLAVHNLAALLCSQGKREEVCHILDQILQPVPYLVDVWLLLADIHVGSDNFTAATQVFKTASESNPYSAKLHYYSALVKFSQDQMDEALEELEQFVLRHYLIPPEQRTRADPNLFFSHLLGLDVPLDKKIPHVKEDVGQLAATKSVYHWLCFCLLMELQGERGEVVDMYELALSATTGAADLCQLWKCYVQFLYRQYSKTPPHTSQEALQQLQEVMMRSITTAPTLLPDPFPRQHQPQLWRDLSHVTSLVEFYLELLAPDVLASALHTFCDLMPDNIALLTRCVEMAVADGQIRRARSLCTNAIYDKVANLHLWKLALALAHQDGTPREVEKLYIGAVTAMPLSMSLWKDFLLFEVSQENSSAVSRLLAQCRHLGLNIQGYMATITHAS